MPCQTIQNYTEHIWRLTNQYNVLQPREWKERVSDVMLDYQLEVIDNVRSGYVGNLPGKPEDLSRLRQMSQCDLMRNAAQNYWILSILGEKVWTLSSSLMFSLTIFTTIGKRALI